MQLVNSKHRFIDSLSKRAKHDVLLLNGPSGGRVVVMSLKEYLWRTSPEGQIPAEDAFPAKSTAADTDVLQIRDYLSD